MVAGHLREKSGYYYAVLNYTDSLGKRKTKWISTGLTVKGNKKRAEAILMDARRNYNPEEPKVMDGDILFADYMEQWLEIIKSSVAVPTLPLPQGLKSSTLKALRGLPPPMSLTCPLWVKRKLLCSLSFPITTRALIFS